MLNITVLSQVSNTGKIIIINNNNNNNKSIRYLCFKVHRVIFDVLHHTVYKKQNKKLTKKQTKVLCLSRGSQISSFDTS